MPGNVSVGQDLGIGAGCDSSCRRSHLLPGTIQRLLNQGISRELLADCLEHELSTHGPARARGGLTNAGRRNLRDWGASPQEVKQIDSEPQRESRPIAIGDFSARERARASEYRARLDPEAKRARDRANSAAYRARKRGDE